MKTILKGRILALVGTLEAANDYFSDSWENSCASNLFAACQEAAMQMGEMLEENEPPLTELVVELEKYCELIYCLYTGEQDDREELVNRLKKAVADIRTGVQDGVSEEKVKAVFLPYNASMWDAFDSVYRAARADPRFDVKVVPIPYYSLNPQGRPREEHYEGREIAKYAEITDYRTYNLATEQPDVVFIHNPYDDCNYVTRILERFFSSELVKYTPHLVYIPYYISKDRPMNGSTHMPGVQNAWRVFVQNEAVRGQYIQEGIVPEKVVALGSPKLDMVACTAKQELPEEWSVLKGKRIFFYNTALSDILGEREKFLKKVRQVVSIFEEQKDSALLWRPHPLSVSTMKAMAPELLEGYLEIVKNFKKSGAGVFDESGELNRAIAVSDAYIGNIDSSVSQLYEATGKPVFYVEYYDPEFTGEDRWARGICEEVVDRKLYMFSWEYNRIFIYDMDSRELRMEQGDPRYAPYAKYLYMRSIAIGNVIYFGLGYAKAILKYDTASGRKKLIELGEGNGPNHYYPGEYVHYKGKLYMLPNCCEEHIKVLDLRTDEVTHIKTHYRQQFPESENLGTQTFFGDNIVVGDFVWRVCWQGTFLQKFDLLHNRLEYIAINGLKEPLCSIAFDGRYFWLVARFGTKIYKWNPQKNQIIHTFEIERTHRCLNNRVFLYTHFLKNGLWIIFREEYVVIRIDVVSGEVETLDFSHLFSPAANGDGQVLFGVDVRIINNCICLFPYNSNGVIKINTQTKEILLERIPVKIELQEDENCQISESMLTLGQYISLVQQEKPVVQKADGEPSGKKIWNYVADHIYT